MVRITNIDLIGALLEDSRKTYRELAERFKVSDTAVRKRMKKLRQDKIIKKYTIEVDERRLGFEVKAIVGVDTSPERYLKVIEELKNMHGIRSMYRCTGDHMILFETWQKTSNGLSKMIGEIEEIDGVTKTCPAMVIEKII